MAAEGRAARLQEDEAEQENILLKVWATHMGLPGSIIYREKMEGKIDHNNIKKHEDMLKDIRTHFSHVNQSVMERSLSRFGKAMEADWHLSAELDDFAQSTAKRIRCMLRDIAQAFAKTKNRKTPAWLVPFAGAEYIGVAAADDICAPLLLWDGATSSPQWLFKYDDSMLAAYRHKVGTIKFEYCHRMAAPPGASDSDDIVAYWEDGVSWPVPSVTVAEYKEGKVVGKHLPSGSAELPAPKRTKASKAKTGEPDLWAGNHRDGGPVAVRHSSAKEKKWVILWWTPVDSCRKQAIQIVINTLGEQDQKKASDFMIGIAKEFAGGLPKTEIEKKKKHFAKCSLGGAEPAGAKPAGAIKAKPAMAIKAKPAMASSLLGLRGRGGGRRGGGRGGDSGKR